MSAAQGTLVRQRDPFPARWSARLAWAGLAVYTLYALGQMNFFPERVLSGWPQAMKLLGRMFPPNTQADKLDLITQGLLESVQIAVIATFVGVILSLPLALMAARNLAPRGVAVVARGFIAVCRSFHPVIVSILFVKAVGFGALAGVLALLGFISGSIAISTVIAFAPMWITFGLCLTTIVLSRHARADGTVP